MTFRLETSLNMWVSLYQRCIGGFQIHARLQGLLKRLRVASSAQHNSILKNSMSAVSTRNLLKISLTANIFEWYDFIIYAYLADVMGQIFFNAADSISGLIRSFAVFAIGYCARPLGSLFFGILGDRIGRATPLKTSLMMMAVPAACIGLLPTYHDIGVWAPVLLLALRVMQGFAAGGELPISACYIFEVSPPVHRSLLCSVVMCSQQLGALLASFVIFILFRYFEHQTVLAWAWRIPFWISIPLTVSIGMMRREIHAAAPQSNKQFDPLWRLLKSPMLRTVPIVLFLSTLGYILLVWLSSYLTHFLGYPRHSAQLMNTVVLAVLICFILTGGTIACFYGYQRVIQTALIVTLVSVVPLWFGLQIGSFSIALIVQLVLAALFGIMLGVSYEAIAAQFKRAVRCRGMTLADTFPTVFAGGTAPLICTWAVDRSGFLMFPAFYILFLGLLALPATWRLEGKR